ncbi:UDP-3-O-[3-hydroxymyristoyl] N-acetylglucosamine deacetylase [hydrothermal vent metagenome]|uniref:UDP-3-O-acyl-N-acetylglucosamine deacetylase n=1 Tax=hydrothermal vent metagenome TaxID=652676 RepID=A0A3B1E7K2_9ZZZZ
MIRNTQLTIAKPVEVLGIGIHTGESIPLRLEPSSSNEGVVFYRSDKKSKPIKLNYKNICRTDLATTICSGSSEVSTIEHLMSAIYAYGIDNINIYIGGKEVPILDGSSIGFCMILDEAKIKYLDKPKKIMKITKEVIVKNKNSFVKVSPSDSIGFDYEINFKHPFIGKQKYSFDFSKQSYIENIAKARTFGFMRDVEYMQSKGLAKGADISNAIALDDDKILNPEGLRYKDEFVRHKILDAMGDISVLGMTMLGQYSSYAGSHNLNFLLSKEILKQKAYEIVYADNKNKTINKNIGYAFS